MFRKIFKIDYVKIYFNKNNVSKELKNIRFVLNHKKYNNVNENLWYLSMFENNENLECILKINKEKEIKFIKTKFELIEFLIYNCNDIESLFYYYNEIIKHFEYNDLYVLKDILGNSVFKYIYNCLLYKSLLSNIKYIINCKLFINMKSKKYDNRKYGNEILIKKYIIKNFNIIFPNYVFVKDEFIVKNIGKIDILAKDSISGRDVIIEIKKNKENPNKQLLAYSKGFNNPILIGITNMDKKYYLKEINYIKVSNILKEMR